MGGFRVGDGYACSLILALLSLIIFYFNYILIYLILLYYYYYYLFIYIFESIFYFLFSIDLYNHAIPHVSVHVLCHHRFLDSSIIILSFPSITPTQPQAFVTLRSLPLLSSILQKENQPTPFTSSISLSLSLL